MHPIMDWLVDKLLVRFGRHEAPVLISPSLSPEQPIFLFQGVLSNKRSQPVISEWFGVQPEGKIWQALSLAGVFQAVGFTNGLANRGFVSDHQAEALRKRLPAAVNYAREHMEQQRTERGQALGKRLRDDQRKLKKWYDAALYRLDAEALTARGAPAARLHHERSEVKALYQQRLDWLNDTFSAVNAPYLRVAIVFANSGSK